jgi:hypothetical protein
MFTAIPGVMVTTAESFFVGSATEVAVTDTWAGLGTVDGAVYNPRLEMVPQAAPLQPLPLTDQETAVLAVPVTFAVNCWVSPALIWADLGETLTATEAATVTVADPDFAGSATEVALMVTCGGVGLEGGAV